MSRSTTLRSLVLVGAAVVAALAAAQPVAAQTCQSRSAERQTRLVELYTSEGCSSCPPADRWLSSLLARPDVLAAAFHVDYWDSLGWVDRFGSARHTERQTALQRSSGARFSYTPQVLVDGRDWRAWPTLPTAATPALVQIGLRRIDERQVEVSVGAQRGAPARLALWWALLEDGHVSKVGAGENQGTTLRHDHVVRQYGRLPAWDVATAGSTLPAWRLTASHNGEDGHKARLLVVVTDAVTGAPLQAVQLDC